MSPESLVPSTSLRQQEKVTYLKARGRQPILAMRWKLAGDILPGEAKEELRKRRNSKELTQTKGRKGS